MGKRISVILIVVLAAAAVTFGVLWQSALRDHSDIKALAQAGANEACSRFSDFQKRRDDGDYWGSSAATISTSVSSSLKREEVLCFMALSSYQPMVSLPMMTRAALTTSVRVT